MPWRFGGPEEDMPTHRRWGRWYYHVRYSSSISASMSDGLLKEWTEVGFYGNQHFHIEESKTD